MHGDPGPPADDRRRPRAQQQDRSTGGGLTWPFHVLTEHLGRVILAKSKPGHHDLEPAGGPAADRVVRPGAARRGARPAVDAHPAVADGRVPRRRRGLADRGEGAGRDDPAAQVPAGRRAGRGVHRRRSRSRRTSSGCRCASPSGPGPTSSRTAWLARPPPADGPPVAEDDPRRRACAAVQASSVGATPCPSPTRPTRSTRRPARTPRRGPTSRRPRGRRMDGAQLYFHLIASPANHASDGIASLAGMDAVVDPMAERFVAWFQRLFYQPEGPRRVAGGPPGVPVRGVGAGGRRWREGARRRRSTSRATSTGTTSTSTPSATALGEPDAAAPTPPVRTTLTHAADPGDVQRDAEHALVAVRGRPHQLRRHQARHHRPGQAAADRVRSRLRQRLVPRAVHRARRQHRHRARDRRDATCSANARGSTPPGAATTTTGSDGRCSSSPSRARATRPADLSLVLPPAAQKVLEGAPLEEVLLGRDEMANMVWGDRAAPSRCRPGEPKNGREAAY